MRIKFFVLSLLTCSFAFPQETTAGPAPGAREVKIVNVKSDASQLSLLACDRMFVACQPSEELQAIVVRGKDADVANAERTILQLDGLSAHLAATSVNNVETTVYVIAGSTDALSGVEEVTGEPLSPVVKQLRSIFPYRHYQLLSTMLLRSAQGSGANTEGFLENTPIEPNIDQLAENTIAYGDVKVSATNTTIIKFRKFAFVLGFSHRTGAPPAERVEHKIIKIQTDVDLREGQKVVIGKGDFGSSRACLFVILSARLVQ